MSDVTSCEDESMHADMWMLWGPSQQCTALQCTRRSFYCLLFIVYRCRYVNALRTKSTVYKEKRAELSELRAESGVLARTCEVINIVIYGFNLMQALSYIWHEGAEEHLIQVHACSWSYLALRFWEAGRQVSSRAWQLLRRSEECPGSATQRRTWNELPSRRPGLTRGKEQRWRRCLASSTSWPSGKKQTKNSWPSGKKKLKHKNNLWSKKTTTKNI